MPPGKHGNHVRGAAHPRWQGGIAVSSHGYLKVHCGRGHPEADPHGYVYVHLLVWMAAGHKRPPTSKCIHHKNENKWDNRIENLQLVDRRAHARYHATESARRLSIAAHFAEEIG